LKLVLTLKCPTLQSAKFMEDKRGYSHISLKPTIRVQTDFDIPSQNDVEPPEFAKVQAEDYKKSKKLSDEYGKDLILVFERNLIYAFDFFYNSKKIFIPELNPVTIFYSNAIMSKKRLDDFKLKLLEESPSLKDMDKNPDLKLFGDFFQLASNCIFNLQGALESFANIIIPPDYSFIDKNGDVINRPSLSHKLFNTIPKIKEKEFKKHCRRGKFVVENIIKMRNNIVHLKPTKEQTNTKFKNPYRRLIKYNFSDAIKMAREYINFYEPNLIEDCNCGKEYFFDIIVSQKNQ